MQREAERMVSYRKSIRRFIKDMWGLEPQPVKPEYTVAWTEVCLSTHGEWEEAKKRVSAEWFGDFDTVHKKWRWYSFEKGKHLTWQQNLILIGIEKAVAGQASRKLSTVSGHGIGKSATCSWIVLWFLYSFYESQVPCTAPTAHQMHDVLWKELSLWISRIKDQDVKELYDWKTEYVRIKYAPEGWFARARTSSKENTEAIAGVHADHVAIIVDEASGVPEQVFTTAQGALTSGNVLFVMISNGTQTMGYFFDSHHKNAEDWQVFQFDGEESPMVDRGYVDSIEKQHGRDSEEFGIRVSGKFAGSGSMDDTGYIQLIPRERVGVRLYNPEMALPFTGQRILGIDPAGDGKDKATFVVRDRFKARLVHEMATSNDKEIAEAALTLMDMYKVKPEDVVIGAFGTGADVAKEMALSSKGEFDVYSVMEGNSPEQEEDYNGHRFERHEKELVNSEADPDTYRDLYLNIRALMYFRAKDWLYAGGVFEDTSVDKSKFVNEMVVIRYKRTLQGNRIQLMSKKEMGKLRIPSPNIADAFSLTFLRDMEERGQTEEERERIRLEEESMSAEERHAAI